MKSITTIITLLFGSVMVIAQTTPAICIATVDPGTNYNMVGWDTAAFPALSYNIYQETSPGVYAGIENVPHGSLSVYQDISSDPDVGSSSYKITTMDVGGVESAQSTAFSTMARMM